MGLSTQVLAIVLGLVMAIHGAHGYIIDAACNAEQTTAIHAAVREALSMAEHGGWRVANAPDSVGFFTQEMLGSSIVNPQAPSLFVRRMTGMPSVVGDRKDAPFRGPQDRKLDTNVLFRCGDGAAVESPANKRYWYDKDFPDRFPAVKYEQLTPEPKIAVCAPKVLAMTAFTEKTVEDPNEPMPHSIVYLCPRALSLPATIGKGWKTMMWQGEKFGKATKFLSHTILHELLHAQRADNLKPDLDGTLPSGLKEQYGYKDIYKLEDDRDKIANAESYAMLANVMYIKSFKIGHGGRFGGPVLRPSRSPRDGHEE